MHERDEGGYHQGQPRQQHRGQLVAQALAHACGHDGQQALPAQQPLHAGQLQAAEGGVAKHAAQHARQRLLAGIRQYLGVLPRRVCRRRRQAGR